MIDAEQLRVAIEAAQHGVVVTDVHGTVEFANQSFCETSGYSESELVGNPISLLNSGTNPPEYFEKLWKTISSGESWKEEITNRRKDGTTYSAFQIIAPVSDGAGGIRSFVAIQHDVTTERTLRLELDQTLQEFDAIFTYTRDALFLIDVTTDTARPFVYRKLSATHEQLTGLSSDAVRGKTPEEITEPQQAAAITARYRQCVEADAPIDYEETLSLPSGTRVWHTTLTPVHRDGAIIQLVGSSRDITARKEMEDELRYLSEVDALTGIPNRRKITEELERELSRAQRHRHPFSVLIMDVDHFKSVNDEHGHEAGDAVLRGIAATASAVLRPSDRIGRWGGEEFAVCLPETAARGAHAAAERIRSAIEGAKLLDDHPITVSIGIATMGTPRTALPRALTHTVDSLIRIADEELYRAKESGRNRVCGAE